MICYVFDLKMFVSLDEGDGMFENVFMVRKMS